jgi:hypothetical protein
VKIHADFLVGSGGSHLKTNMTASQRNMRNQVTPTYSVKGGHISHWLRLRSDNVNTIQDEWGRSVTADNLFPVRHKLQPLWLLLGHPEMNHSKAIEVKEYLMQKWAQEQNSIPDHPMAVTSKEVETSFRCCCDDDQESHMNCRWYPRDMLTWRGKCPQVFRDSSSPGGFCGTGGSGWQCWLQSNCQQTHHARHSGSTCALTSNTSDAAAYFLGEQCK